MCNTCRVVRKATEDVEKMTKEEIDKIFSDVAKLVENEVTKEI